MQTAPSLTIGCGGVPYRAYDGGAPPRSQPFTPNRVRL